MPTLLDQASYTLEQLNQINTRLDGAGPFFSTANGYYGEGSEMLSGTALFLNEEETGNFSGDYTWMQTASPVTLGIFDGEPRPGENPAAPSNSNEIDYPEFATLVMAAWSGRSETVTLAGVTQSKDAQSKRIGRALFDLILRKAQDAKLDFTNTTKYPTDRRNDSNPIFVLMAKVNRYISMYKVIEHQITDYTPYIDNKATVDAWCLGAATFAKTNIDWRFNIIFEGLPPYADGSSVREGSNSLFTHTHYNSSGVLQYQVNDLLEGTWNNRMMSLFGVVDSYAVNFNDTSLRDDIYEYYKFWLEIAIFPDGTNFENYRALEDNIGDQGITYTSVQMAEWIKIAHSHAVAVTNGMIVGEDAGKFYNYTTSRGSDMFPTFATTSTTGGPKNMASVIKNVSRYYRNAANGGYTDVRFAGPNGTLPMNGVNKKFTSLYGLANAYLQDLEIDDFVNMRGVYAGAQDSGYGSWPHHGTGAGFGLMSTYGYIGGTNMSNIFTTVITNITNPLQNFYSTFFND